MPGAVGGTMRVGDGGSFSRSGALPWRNSLLLRFLAFGSDFRRRFQRPGLSFLLESMSLSAFSFNWLFRSLWEQSIVAAQVLGWMFFIASVIDILLVVYCVLKSLGREQAFPPLSFLAKHASWLLLSLLMVQYIFFQGILVGAQSVPGTVAFALLIVSGAWSIVFLGPLLHFFGTDLRMIAPSLGAVSLNLYPLAFLAVQVLLIAVDIISISVDARLVYYIAGGIVAGAYLLVLMFLSPYRTPEGNWLAQTPLVLVLFGIGFEAGGVTTLGIVLPIMLVASALWYLPAAFCFSRSYLLSIGAMKSFLATHRSTASAFDMDTAVMYKARTPMDACRLLMNIVRRRLDIRFLHAAHHSSAIYIDNVEAASEFRDIAEVGFETFPESHFFAVQYCVLCRDLNLHSMFRSSWAFSGSIRRLMLSKMLSSLLDLSVAFELHDLAGQQWITLDTVSERGGADGVVAEEHLSLGRLRAAAVEIDDLRRRILVLTALMFREILSSTSNAAAEERMAAVLRGREELKSTRFPALKSMLRRKDLTSTTFDPIYQYVDRIVQLETRGRAALVQLKDASYLTPEMMRCRGRWLRDVDSDLGEAMVLFSEADFLEEYLNSSAALRAPRGSFASSRRMTMLTPPRSGFGAGIVPGTGAGAGQLPGPLFRSSPDTSRAQTASAATATAAATAPVTTAGGGGGGGGGGGRDSEDDSLGSSQTETRSSDDRRLHDLRSAARSRKSASLQHIGLAIGGTLLVCAALIIALFVVSRSFINPPLSLTLRSGPTPSTTNVFTGSLEATSRIRRTVAADALFARTMTWKNYLLETEMDFYRTVYADLPLRTSGLNSIIRTGLTSSDLETYWDDMLTIKTLFYPKQGATLQSNSSLSDLFSLLFANRSLSDLTLSYVPDISQESACVTNSSDVDVSYFDITGGFLFAQPNGSCAEIALQNWFNALSTVFSAYDNAIPLYQTATDSFVDSMTTVIIVLAVVAFSLALGLLLLVLIPSIYRSFRDQERIVDLLFTVDRAFLKARAEQLMSQVTEEENFLRGRSQSVGGISAASSPSLGSSEPSAASAAGPLAAGAPSAFEEVEFHPQGSSVASRRMLTVTLLISFALLLIMAYSQVFTIVLAVFISLAKRIVYEVVYITDVSALFFRATGAAIELYPISSPNLLQIAFPGLLFNVSSVPLIAAVDQFTQRALNSFQYLLTGDGVHTDGIADLSSGIYNALYTPYAASTSTFPDTAVRSLAADVQYTAELILRLANPSSYLSNSNIFTIYREQLQPILVSVTPIKFDNLYNEFVSYYSGRTATLATVANYFFGFSFLLLPLLYWICFHRVLRSLYRFERRLRKSMCMLDLPTIQSSPPLLGFMASGVLDRSLKRRYLFFPRSEREAFPGPLFTPSWLAQDEKDALGGAGAAATGAAAAAATTPERVAEAATLPIALSLTPWIEPSGPAAAAFGSKLSPALRSLAFPFIEFRKDDLSVVDANSAAASLFNLRLFAVGTHSIAVSFVDNEALQAFLRYLKKPLLEILQERKSFRLLGLRHAPVGEGSSADGAASGIDGSGMGGGLRMETTGSGVVSPGAFSPLDTSSAATKRPMANGAVHHGTNGTTNGAPVQQAVAGAQAQPESILGLPPSPAPRSVPGADVGGGFHPAPGLPPVSFLSPEKEAVGNSSDHHKGGPSASGSPPEPVSPILRGTKPLVSGMTPALSSSSPPPPPGLMGAPRMSEGRASVRPIVSFPCIIKLVPALDRQSIRKDSSRSIESEVLGMFVQDVTEQVRQKTLLEDEKKRSNDLLLNMLPAAVADRLKKHERPLAFSSKQVTIVFLDIVGFSAMTRSKVKEGPAAIVNLLNDMYSRFDEVAERLKVYKIQLIGDAWLGAANLIESLTPARRYAEEFHDTDVQQAALATVRFCHEVIHIAREFDVHIRCGVHTGDVISGVVSRTRYQFSIIGEAVDIAHDLEQTCPRPDVVHMSRQTYELVYKWCDCEEADSVLPSVGPAKTYVLLEFME